MRDPLRTLENWLQRLGLSAWREDRENLVLIYASIDFRTREIAERSFDVTFDQSIAHQRRVDICLTLLGLAAVAVAVLSVCASIGLEFLPRTLSWSLVFFIFALPLAIVSSFVMVGYLSLLLVPLLLGLRYIISLGLPSLSLIRFIRQISVRN